MPWRSGNSEPTVKERILAGLSYLTFGIAGLLYILLSRQSSQSQQFRFHFIQSILLWIIGSMLGYAAAPIMGLAAAGASLLPDPARAGIMMGLGGLVGLLTIAFRLLILYGAVWAFLGKSAEVPLISPVVRQNMR